MWIKCSECKVYFQTSRNPMGEYFVTQCPNCNSMLDVEIKVSGRKDKESE